MISVYFQGKPFNITVIQVYALTSNAEETEVEWFYEDLQDLLELTPKNDVIFIIGDWNAKKQILIAAIFISPYYMRVERNFLVFYFDLIQAVTQCFAKSKLPFVSVNMVVIH